MSAPLAALDRPALAPLWDAVHARLSTGLPVRSVRVGPLDDDQQSALADLLGLDRLPGDATTVRLDRLDAVLHSSFSVDTRTAVETLRGPVGDRAGVRATAERARRELWAWLAAHPVVAAEPALASWVADVGRAGVVDGSPQATRALLDTALRVIAALPADGAPLPTLADAVLGRTHALDDGTRLSTLVLRALAALYGVPAPTDADGRRALWERAGVANDEVSTQVLVAGLRPTGDDALSHALRLWARAGQASVVTLAQLRGCPGLRVSAGPVWIVENPSLVTMAIARFAASCPPLVCTAGWPSGAAIMLLRQLAASGAHLRYHGDFDGDGLRIAAHVMARTGAEPWRMATADYLAAASPQATGAPLPAVIDGPASLPAVGPVTAARPGQVSEAPWDADLAAALRARDLAVPEERVAPLLLADLVPT
ncbi:TIGR02679 family protein [Frankia gtarii]|uniref:TIGR02679 family protein n=1 Tax=Frankia gtarii TaxID=2950102 RepID=UPI0021C115EA|nr:TIGR02679 family protein [Frankia gtarii]